MFEGDFLFEGTRETMHGILPAHNIYLSTVSLYFSNHALKWSQEKFLVIGIMRFNKLFATELFYNIWVMLLFC